MVQLRKYEPASRFDEVEDALYWLERGYYFWFRHRPYHAGFISGWHVRNFLAHVRDGSLTRAKIRGEWLKCAVDREVAKMQAAQHTREKGIGSWVQ